MTQDKNGSAGTEAAEPSPEIYTLEINDQDIKNLHAMFDYYHRGHGLGGMVTSSKILDQIFRQSPEINPDKK